MNTNLDEAIEGGRVIGLKEALAVVELSVKYKQDPVKELKSYLKEHYPNLRLEQTNESHSKGGIWTKN